MKFQEWLEASRGRSFRYCIAVYLVAIAAAVATGDSLHHSSLVLKAGAGDLAATLVVFIASVTANNSSVYDPYWSAAPVPIAFFWILNAPGAVDYLDLTGVVAFILVLIWAIRLTNNWARGWRGLGQEDWRYRDFRKFPPVLYWLVSFFGFHLFPTVLVFLGSLSLFPILAAHSTTDFHGLDALAILIIAGAIWIEARADVELHEFKANPENRGQLLESGIWRFSRHPNYFGEVSFWWGLYLAGLASNSSYWWTIIGPIAISALFIFVSIPMMELHMIEHHSEYLDARVGRSALVPWFRRSTGD